MTHALVGAPLLAFSIKVVVIWPRFILAMLVMASLVVAAAYAFDNGKPKKK
jgi:hypothetical protein